MILIMIIFRATVSVYREILAYIIPYGCDCTEVRLYDLFNIIINGVDHVSICFTSVPKCSPKSTTSDR